MKAETPGESTERGGSGMAGSPRNVEMLCAERPVRTLISPPVFPEHPCLLSAPNTSLGMAERRAIHMKKHNKNKIFSRCGSPKEDLRFKARGTVAPTPADAVARYTDVEGDHSLTHKKNHCRNHLFQMDFLSSHRMWQASPECSCQAFFRIKTASAM